MGRGVSLVWKYLEDQLLELPKNMYDTSSMKLSPKSAQSSNQSMKEQEREEELDVSEWSAEKHPPGI